MILNEDETRQLDELLEKYPRASKSYDDDGVSFCIVIKGWTGVEISVHPLHFIEMMKLEENSTDITKVNDAAAR
jgi:hypothetical protein